MQVSIADLLRYLKQDVQLKLIKLHKEVINIIYMRIFIDIDSKQSLEYQFRSIVDEIGIRSLTGKFCSGNFDSYNIDTYV